VGAIVGIISTECALAIPPERRTRLMSFWWPTLVGCLMLVSFAYASHG
jgi:hypothetical protein